jgi:hypothetical protein
MKAAVLHFIIISFAGLALIKILFAVLKTRWSILRTAVPRRTNFIDIGPGNNYPAINIRNFGAKNKVRPNLHR